MENNTPLSRVEDILQSTIDNTEYDKPPQSRVESLLIELKGVIEGGGGGGSAYHPAGSVDYVSELPSPSADYLGYVYDITQAFTTTSDFKEGAGKRYPAGSNIAIVDVGTPESPSYKYDVLSGFIDTSNFVEKEAGKGLSTNDYTDADKTKLASLENYDDTEIRNEIAAKADDADLAAVAKSGAYSDLSGTPTIPSKTSDLTNDSGFVTNQINDASAGNNSTYSSNKIVSEISGEDISSTTTGINPSITDSADGLIQDVTVYGRTDTVEGELHGIGEDGELEITTANSDNSESSTASITTGIPLYAVNDIKDELSEKRGMVVKRREKVVFDGSEDWSEYAQSAIDAYGNHSFFLRFSDAPKARYMASSQLPNQLCNILTIASQDAIYGGTVNTIGLVGDSGNQSFVQIRQQSCSTVADLKTYLASNPVTVVYELAEPYEIPLTASELSQLRNLRTYASTTNVTVTDAPTVDIGYLLDTDNGRAVADVHTGLQGQISNIPAWLTDIPENHKNIYRGKYLGNSVSAAQLAAIADGSFDDLYVGDYWEIPVTIDGTTVSNKWRIADFDYFLHNGTAKHHAVIVPDNTLYTDQMGGNISYGYYQSAMFTTNLNKGRTAIADAFPDMVISYECYDIINSTVTKYDCTAELMALSSLTGVYSDYIHTNYLPVLPQMSLFRIMPDFIGANPNGSGHDAGFLTQTVKTSSFYWAISTRMQMMEMRTSDSYGVRPFFLLGDASNI